MADESQSLDLFADSPTVYGKTSYDGEIEVAQLPESLEEPPTVEVPVLQIDPALEELHVARLDETVDLLDTAVEQDVEGQISFVDFDEWWKAEWQGMPEYVQEDISAWNTIGVNFRSREDMLAFADFIGQRLTNETRSIWYPKLEFGSCTNRRYISDES